MILFIGTRSYFVQVNKRLGLHHTLASQRACHKHLAALLVLHLLAVLSVLVTK